MERPNAWKNYDDEALAMLEAVSVALPRFSGSRQNRARMRDAKRSPPRRRLAMSIWSRPSRSSAPLKPGDKVYVNCMGKAVMLFHLGEEPLEKGVNIVGAHIDSPRIDIKQNPFYED